MRRSLVLALSLPLGLLAGCSESVDGRVAVSGKVHLKGKPLDQGSIQFFSKEKNELAGGGMIQNGEYDIPAKQGLKPGTYRIVITSGEPGTAAKGPPGDSSQVAKERIPPQYNAHSLQKPVYREVDGESPVDFDIK